MSARNGGTGGDNGEMKSILRLKTPVDHLVMILG